MKLMRFILCLLYLTAWVATAQTATDTQAIYNEARTLLYSNTKKAKKLTEYLIKNPSGTIQKNEALVLLASIDNLTGNYTEATDLLFDALALTETTHSRTNILVALAAQCRILGIKDKAAFYLNKATTIANKLQQNSIIKQEKALQLLATGNNKQALLLFYELEKNNADNIQQRTALCNNIAAAHLQLHGTDSATAWYKKSLAVHKDIYAKVGLTNILVEKKEYSTAIENLTQLLPDITASDDIDLKTNVYKNLSDSYNELNDVANYKKYTPEFDVLYELANEQKNKARTLLLNHIDKGYEMQQTAKESRYTLLLYITAGSLLLFIAVAAVYFLILNKNYRQYQNIISRLDQAENSKPVAAVVPENKTYAISEKTEKALLEKLQRFEESERFTSKSISLNTLAKQLDTNTKYLSELINTNKSGNFNTYINELRIKYILKKLKSDPVYLNYKVSYLAEESGFSSHSAFATVFKTVTGISPTTYISFLKQETNIPNPDTVANHE